MEDLNIKEISEKYNENEKVIRILFNISFEHGLSIKDTEKMLNKFYSN